MKKGGMGGKGWDRLEPVRTDWNKLEPVGTGWNGLEQVGTGWERFGQVETGWKKVELLGTGCSEEQRGTAARTREQLHSSNVRCGGAHLCPSPAAA